MYERHVGKVDEGKYVLHKCDVRCCCNPDHLYVGDQKENMRDMTNRGRIGNRGQKPGEKHANAKLNWDTVRKMRSLYQQGASLKALREMSQVSRSQVSRIISGERWKSA